MSSTHGQLGQGDRGIVEFQYHYPGSIYVPLTWMTGLSRGNQGLRPKMLETQLHLISAVLILLAAIVPIYLTIKLKDNLKKLTAILSIFILIHAVYQVVGFLGLTLLADGVFEPLSVAVLIFFGINYSDIAKQRNMSIKNMVVVLSPGTLLLLMNSITIMLLLGALGIFVWLGSQI